MRSIATRSRAHRTRPWPEFNGHGKYEPAIEDFNAALNVDANNSEAWQASASATKKLHNHAKAVESYQRAVTANPNNSEARSALQRFELRRAEAWGHDRNCTLQRGVQFCVRCSLFSHLTSFFCNGIE